MNFCSGVSFFRSSTSPLASAGSSPVGASSSPPAACVEPDAEVSASPCSYTAIHPLNVGTDPFARRMYPAASTSSVVSSKVAGGICDATNRFQISR